MPIRRLLQIAGAVRVARQIGQHRFGSAERALAVDDPFGSTQWPQRGSEGRALGKMGVIAEELQAAGIVSGDELCQEQASKEPRERRCRH